jgi:magnesium transporter
VSILINIYHNSVKSPSLERLVKPKKGAWVHVESPDKVSLERLAEEFSLDIDLLQDGMDINESPRIEQEGQNLYIFTRYCLPENQQMTTSPLLIIYTAENLLTICRTGFNEVERIVNLPNVFTSKRTQLILQILSEVNQGFKLRINEVSRKILRMRSRLDRAHIDNKDFLSILDLEEDLNDLLWVMDPMEVVLNNLLTGRYIKLYEEDEELIEDLSLSTKELIQLTRSRLTAMQNIRDAYNTIATNNLNKAFRLLTSIAILIGSATMITSLYGMNVRLPFAESKDAFWLVFGMVVTVVGLVIWLFRRQRWL